MDEKSEKKTSNWPHPNHDDIKFITLNNLNWQNNCCERAFNKPFNQSFFDERENGASRRWEKTNNIIWIVDAKSFYVGWSLFTHSGKNWIWIKGMEFHCSWSMVLICWYVVYCVLLYIFIFFFFPFVRKWNRWEPETKKFQFKLNLLFAFMFCLNLEKKQENLILHLCTQNNFQ